MNKFLAWGALLAASCGVTPALAYKWTFQPIEGVETLKSVISAEERFVAVSGDVVWSTTDGERWAPTPTGAKTALNAIAHQARTYVAVGDGGLILTSSDGESWKTETSGTEANLIAVAAGGGKFAALTADNAVLVSSDGSEWSAHDLGGTKGGDGRLNAIGWTGDRFTAVGDAGAVYTSSPEVDKWTAAGIEGVRALWGVAAGAGMLVAVGDDGKIFVKTSKDWVAANARTSDRLNAVIWTGGQFVAVGDAGSILYSADGDSWSQDREGEEALTSVAWGKSLALIGGPAGGAFATPVAAPEFSFPSSHVATVNTEFTLVPESTGGAVTTWSVEPALPDGVTLDVHSGMISGTPSSLMAATAFTVIGINPDGADTAVVTLSVKGYWGTLTYLQNPGLYSVNQGMTMNRPVIVDAAETPVGLTYAVVSGGLPAGVSLGAGTGNIFGEPSETGTFTPVIRASNADGFAEATVTLIVRSAAPAVSYTPSARSFFHGAPVAEVAPVNAGGVVTAWSITPALPQGLLFNPTTGRISGTPAAVSASASYTITAQGHGGTQSQTILTIEVTGTPPAISYTNDPVAFTVGEPASLARTGRTGTVTSYAISPALPGGLLFNPTSGVISGTPTAVSSARDYVITATGPGGSGRDTVNIAVTTPAPVISYTNDAVTFTLNQPASLARTGRTGIVTAYAIAPALPAGLLFNTTSGVVSGTPTTVSAPTDYVITATGPGGNGRDTVNIAVTTPAPTVSYANDPLTFVVGQEIATVSRTGLTGIVTSYAISPALPAGLAFNPTSGRLSGTPVAASTPADYVITATGPGGSGRDTIRVEVVPNPPVIGFAVDTVRFTVGTEIAALRPARSGGPITGWSITTGSNGARLTANTGLLFNPTTGFILGTPDRTSESVAYGVIAHGRGGTADTAVIVISTLAPGRKLAAGESDVALVRVTEAATDHVLRLPALPEQTGLSIVVSDLAGHTVWSRHLKTVAGMGTLTWNGRDRADRRVAAGLYLVRMTAHRAGEPDRSSVRAARTARRGK